MFATSISATCSTSFVDSFRLDHQVSGSCSAQPDLLAEIFISCFGLNAEAMLLPVSVSITLAFTEELPTS